MMNEDLHLWLDVPAVPDERASRPRVQLVTEGTYPFVMGGVSSWCDMVVSGIDDVDWLVYALTGGELDAPMFQLPAHAELSTHVQLWGQTGQPTPRRPTGRRSRPSSRPRLAARLVEGLLGWDADPFQVVQELAWCRENAESVLPTFRSDEHWDHYVAALTKVLQEQHPEIGVAPPFDLSRAIDLYHSLSWVARTAATPGPRADVSLVTTAGWAAIPAVVDKALHGTPIVLSEHGLYVREAYLAAVRSTDAPASRFVNTRLSRGLTRLAYAFSDVVAPVANANRPWEEALGVPPDNIITIPNGVPAPSSPQPAPGTRTVVGVGRVDPLKDVQTMLRVAAAVCRRVPDATFLHYGPVPRGQEGYMDSARRLHEELGLGERFRFMGPTSDPTGAMRDADVVLMTSISEGFPMTVLEAQSQARPVVTTVVGGVLDAMRGAGLTAPPGDVHGLADAVCTLLTDPGLATELGERGHARVRRLFGRERCLTSYREVLLQLSGRDRDAPRQRSA